MNIFTCTNKRCRAYHVEVVTGQGPAEIRKSIGQSLRCALCGGIMRWIRHEVPSDNAAMCDKTTFGLACGYPAGHVGACSPRL